MAVPAPAFVFPGPKGGPFFGWAGFTEARPAGNVLMAGARIREIGALGISGIPTDLFSTILFLPRGAIVPSFCRRAERAIFEAVRRS